MAMKPEALRALSPGDVSRTRTSILPHVLRTPLLRSRAAAGADVFLKCEHLQITGSFKLRGAVSALLAYQRHHPDAWDHMRRRGVVTCSSGNFAQALAHAAARLGLDYAVVVPESISPFKVARVLRYHPGAEIIRAPYEAWQQTMVSSRYPGHPGFFLSSESDDYVTLGTATVALEILEDLPGVDAILVPFGGGNLAWSVASLLRGAGRATRVYAVEVETGAPLSASMRAGAPVEVDYEPSFVDGIGASFVIPEQFRRLQGLLAGVLTVTPREIAAALAALVRVDEVLAEGAGAAAFAAALKFAPAHGWERPCAVVSGGAIDPETLRAVLRSVAARADLRDAPLAREIQ